MTILADPVLGTARPDIEQLVHDRVRPLGGVITWAYAVTDGPLRGWHATTSLQVDVRAHRRAAARDRADQARRLICGLPWAVLPGVVVLFVNVADGPFWLPDSNGGPRYVARYEIGARPAALSPLDVPGGPAGPMPAARATPG